jgi:hypothetical protein
MTAWSSAWRASVGANRPRKLLWILWLRFRKHLYRRRSLPLPAPTNPRASANPSTMPKPYPPFSPKSAPRRLQNPRSHATAPPSANSPTTTQFRICPAREEIVGVGGYDHVRRTFLSACVHRQSTGRTSDVSSHRKAKSPFFPQHVRGCDAQPAPKTGASRQHQRSSYVAGFDPYQYSGRELPNKNHALRTALPTSARTTYPIPLQTG